jgi:hypothetical protein
MARVIDTRPVDDRCCVWVCPVHGVIDEGELAEGVDWSQGTSPIDGDVAWTDQFYCQREHAEGQSSLAVLVDVLPDVRQVVEGLAAHPERTE